MSSRVRAWPMAAALALWAGGAAAASWQPVPGAPGLEADLASAVQERSRVQAWIRTAEESRSAQELKALAAATPPAYHTALQVEFDCARRILRPLAAQGHDAGGALLFLSSLSGAERPVPQGPLGWAYDSLCEAARTLAARELPAVVPGSGSAGRAGGTDAARCRGHPRAPCVNAAR
jgi:hypothetical protein